MVVTVVTVYVRSEHVDSFIDATRLNHESSIQEPGNLRFDVLQSKDDPTRFVLYEAYESDIAAAVHKKTSHYLEWRQTVEPFMARPREGVPCHVLCPTERGLW